MGDTQPARCTAAAASLARSLARSLCSSHSCKCTLAPSPHSSCEAVPTQPSARTRPETELRPQIYSEGTKSIKADLPCSLPGEETAAEAGEPGGKGGLQAIEQKTQCEKRSSPTLALSLVSGSYDSGLAVREWIRRRSSPRESDGGLTAGDPCARGVDSHATGEGSERKKGKESAQKHCNGRGHKRSDRVRHGTDQRR